MTPANTTPKLRVYDGRDLLGHLVDRGEAGVEAFTADDRSVGLFKDDQDAARELWRRARGQTPAVAVASRTGAHPRFVITFTSAPGVDGIRSLRLLLKAARRRFGLIAIDAYEDRSSPLEISNLVADEFRELRDEIVAERAARGAEGSRP